MATFTIDLLTGKVFLFNKDFSSSGGSGGGSGSTYSEVGIFSALPSAPANNGKIFVVRNSTGSYVLNRKEAGLYYSNGSIWRRLGDIPSFFNVNNFQVFDSGNTTAIKFSLTGITSGSTRVLNVQNSSGTIAYLTDLNSKVDVSAFVDYTGTTAPATYLSKGAFNSYSATTLSLIGTKQDLLSAGTGIQISGNTISVKLPSILQLKDVSGGTEVNTIPHTPIIWSTQEYSGNSLSFTGGSRIYVQETAEYGISYLLNLAFISGAKKNVGTVIKRNGTTLITPLTSSSNMDSVNKSGTNAMPQYKVSLTNGDYIELYAFRVGNSGSVQTLPDGNWIKIKKII